MRPLLLLTLAISTLLLAARATAQPRAYVFGTAGYGSLGDDEGSLGTGPVVGAGAGWSVSERLSLEAALTSSRHEQRGSPAWKGEPFAATVRLLYHFGDSGARARIFVAGGVGYFRYPGTRTDTIYSAATAPPRMESENWLVSGTAVDAGGGVDVSLGARWFVRPEVWLTVANVERRRPAPEPPYAVPRATVSLGFRF